MSNGDQIAADLGLGSVQQFKDEICNYDRRDWFGVLCWQNVSSFQLDIVGFLAILGEGSVLSTSQAATLSRVFCLPRLLPAPQALMRPFRPVVLDAAAGSATAVWAGNHRDYINHIGNVLLDAESLPPFAVRCVEIIRVKKHGEVKAKMFGPLWLVAIMGFIMSAALLGIACWQNDGFAILATIALSLLSSLVGLGNKWKLNLPTRKPSKVVPPPGDVVIRYPKGSFVVVECSEDVARELFFAPEAIDYLIGKSWKYQMVALVGTFLLMVGVVALGNSTTWLQIGFAASYVILNAAYWLVAALPAKSHWDLSCFEVRDQRIETADDKLAGTAKLQRRNIDPNDTYTWALWKVIVATKDTDWVSKGQAAPQTEAWNQWLYEAKSKAKEVSYDEVMEDGKPIKVWALPEWNPQDELNALLSKENKDKNSEKV